MNLRTPVCDLFGTEVPIVQTGMGWVAGARLVAATANAGALGILASATMTLPELERAIASMTENSTVTSRTVPRRPCRRWLIALATTTRTAPTSLIAGH